MENQYQVLTIDGMATIVGGKGKKKNWSKCYAGTIGSAMLGATGGPVTYIGGALVGYATFCQ
ncbi:Blp family class II bacteriocin [Weissella hellenica]|nr:Blp family class II bacteriocin [Weissella hellenica]